MQTLISLKKEMIDIAELGAMAVLKLQNPSFDNIRQNEAYSIAGRKWIEFHRKKGSIKRFRLGTAKNSAWYYSRLEIVALMKSEREFKVTFK